MSSERRWLVPWCVAAVFSTAAVVGCAAQASISAFVAGIMLQPWLEAVATWPGLHLLAAPTLLAFGLAADQLGAWRTLRAGFFAVCLAGGALCCDALVWPEVLAFPPPPRPGELGRCGNSLVYDTWSFWAARLLGLPAIVALLVAGVRWGRDAWALARDPRGELLREAALVAFVSAPLLVGALPLLQVLPLAPPSVTPQAIHPRTALATTLLLAVPLAVAAGRALFVRVEPAPETS